MPLTFRKIIIGGFAILGVATVLAGGLYYWVTRPTIDGSPSSPLHLYRDGHKTAIIFVHGILGQPKDTFIAVHSKALWPELLMDDALFNDVDIFTYGYASDLFSKGLTIKQLGEEMHLALAGAGITRYEKLIFVCHSMGGLVARSYMVQFREEMRGKVSFMYFFGTPASGSEIATIGRYIFPNSHLANMAVRGGEAFLQDLQKQWFDAGYGRTIVSYCAFEKSPMGPVFIVPWGRAAGLCNQSLIEMRGNHLEIVKPENIEDKPHLALRAAFIESSMEQSQYEVRLVPSNSITLAYNDSSQLLTLGFKAVVKSARGAGDVIQDMYSTLHGPKDTRVPFSDSDHHCYRDEKEVNVPFLFGASELTCVIDQRLGDLTRTAFEHAGDYKVAVTFETDDKRGHTLQYCFSLDDSDLDSLLNQNGHRRFRYATCRG